MQTLRKKFTVDLLCTRRDSNPEPSDPYLASKSELLVP